MKKFITLFLVIAALAAIVYGSWHFYQKSQSNKQSNQDSSKYLVINEWGVRFKLSSANYDGKYALSSDGKNAYLSTPRLETIKGCEKGEMISLERAKENEAIGSSDVESVKANNPDALIHIDDYYYLYNTAPFMCSQNSADQEYLQELRKTFGEDVKTLEPVT